MLAQELVTAVQEGVKLTIVLVDNHGYASIGALSETVGAERFGTAARARDLATGRLDGEVLPVDFAANAESLGAAARRCTTIDELAAALAWARHEHGPVLLAIETDPLVPAPSSESWWDVPVAAVSTLEATAAARAAYETGRKAERPYL
jgi:3D-(3,5/4)-trihydroxycyclohexane-1,2-dione acylhydrolase (decyclizing)